ncbi:MAG: hypothetical protein AB7V18_02805 [Pyrinomonadaceae bacterium]
MFCPKCGTGDQSAESYCRQCGDWLRDPDATGGGIFRPTTRDEKIRKMRILELVSIGFSLTSVVIILTFLSGSMDKGLLFLAMACGIVVAFYQAANMYLGHKVTRTLPRQNPGAAAEIRERPIQLPIKATHQLNVPASVTEDVTELLDPLPRRERKTETR